MKKEKTQFTLKLSREKIQLLLINGQGEFQEIGKADPNDPEITQNLQTLREQVSALSGNCPLVNVMLPDDLILVQNLTIENVNQPITASKALDIVSKACELDKAEINVAVGVPTSHRTQPIAAVTTKTINETRLFLNNSGFHTSQFIASKIINGFNNAPVFVEDPVPKQSIDLTKKSLTIGASIISFFIVLAVFLFALQPFKSTEFTDQLNTSIHRAIVFKDQTDNDIIKKNKSFMVNDPTPDLSDHQKLVTPSISLDDFMQNSSSTDQILNTGNLKPKALTQKANSNPQLTSYANYHYSIKHNILSYFDQKFQSESKINLPNPSWSETILGQYTKLQSLKSMIQFDYLQSIQPNIFHSNDSITINETLGLPLPISQIKKHANKSRIISEPELSFLQDVRLGSLSQDFTTKPVESLKRTPIEQNLSNDFDQKFPKLQNPTRVMRDYKLLKPLNDNNVIEFQIRELTPEEILLSKKLRPIKRPSTIAKINVLAEPTLSSGAVTLSNKPIIRPKLVMLLSPLNPNDVKIVAKATKKPSFPRRASIINNSTISDIIELNRTNLIGVFGTKQNAIALIRLASGKVIRVKVGDRFDGWRVLSISEDKIELANGNKQEILRLPG